MTPPNERSWQQRCCCSFTKTAAVHGMISAVHRLRHYLQKSLDVVSTVQECGLIFLVVKIELKRVFKVPILGISDAANSVSVELNLMEFYLYFTLIKTAKK